MAAPEFTRCGECGAPCHSDGSAYTDEQFKKLADGWEDADCDLVLCKACEYERHRTAQLDAEREAMWRREFRETYGKGEFR